MSKKLIAVAAAAALALTGLVVMPTAATATGPFNVATTGSQATNNTVRDGSTSSKSFKINVPTQNVMRWVNENNSTADVTGTALKMVITTPGATDAITVTSTGGVKVLTDTAFDETAPAPTSASGVTSLTDTAAVGTATIYAYTTSTATGTVVISAAGSSKTIYVSGVSTHAYKIAFTGPASVAPGADASFTGTVKDAFGNDLSTELDETDFKIDAVGGDAATAANIAADDFKYDATTKVYTIKHLSRDDAGAYAISLSVDTAGKISTKVDAFGDTALTAFFTVNALDPAAQITALTAQVAALQAQLENSRPIATSVTKKRYNTLARKWNAAFPSQKVALKK